MGVAWLVESGRAVANELNLLAHSRQSESARYMVAFDRTIRGAGAASISSGG